MKDRYTTRSHVTSQCHTQAGDMLVQAVLSISTAEVLYHLWAGIRTVTYKYVCRCKANERLDFCCSSGKRNCELHESEQGEARELETYAVKLSNFLERHF